VLGRPPAHPGVAVGSTGGDTLEQRQHRAHPVDAVERGDEMHFRRAGIGEARVDTAGDQRANQHLGAGHRRGGGAVRNRADSVCHNEYLVAVVIRASAAFGVRTSVRRRGHTVPKKGVLADGLSM
jgi:hypothetical protein